MSTQLFEEEAPAVAAPKNGRSARSVPAPKPEVALTDPFTEEPEADVSVAEAVVAEEATPEPVIAPVPAPVVVAAPTQVPIIAVIRSLPDERQSLTITLKSGGCDGLVIVGLFEDGTPGEVILLLRNAPAGVAAALEAFAATLTLALPYGIPAGALATQLLALVANASAREAAGTIAAALSARF